MPAVLAQVKGTAVTPCCVPCFLTHVTVSTPTAKSREDKTSKEDFHWACYGSPEEDSVFRLICKEGLKCLSMQPRKACLNQPQHFFPNHIPVSKHTLSSLLLGKCPPPPVSRSRGAWLQGHLEFPQACDSKEEFYKLSPTALMCF